MESINSVATAATKAVWGSGDASKEPVSGVQGDVTKGEPYDAGNLDPDEQEKVETRLSDDKTGDKTDPPDTSDQNDTRDPNDPSEEAVKVDGPGPKPVEQVAREHGGDAGRKEEEPVQAEPEAPMNDAGGSEENKGIGEEHVNTMGFAAEGGGFNATKAGVGKEAGRHLDKKSVDREDHAAVGQSPSTPNGNKTSPTSTPSKHSKAKPSLSQRIKAKLHQH